MQLVEVFKTRRCQVSGKRFEDRRLLLIQCNYITIREDGNSCSRPVGQTDRELLSCRGAGVARRRVSSGRATKGPQKEEQNGGSPKIRIPCESAKQFGYRDRTGIVELSIARRTPVPHPPPVLASPTNCYHQCHRLASNTALRHDIRRLDIPS